ncbi:protein LYRIC isoform X3 [Lethenteron reissneri]|uniref:protein LYRIC isoform X3 n=1 Tax=Lethenteron reissneri TaxID=7753 RepID=UPI002AB62D93|nr:protein LYRIC isoform X3 [Lethenteron reissneri]
MRGTWAESFSLWLGSTGERLAADAGRLLGTHEAVLSWLGLGLVVFVVVFFFSVFLCRRGRRGGGRQRGLAAAGKGGAIPAERSGEVGDEARPSGGAPRSPEDEASVRRRKERAAVKQVTKQQVNGKALTPQSEREAVEKRRSSPVSAVRSPASPSQLEKTGEKTKKAKKKSKAEQKHSSDLQDDETSNWETKVSVREKRQQKKEKRGKEQPGQLTPPVPTSTSAGSIPDGPAKPAAASQRSRPSNSAADHTLRREGSPNPKPSPVAINGGGGGSSTLGWVPPQAGRVPTASAWAEQGWASGSGTGSGLVAPSGTPCVDAESTTATARATLNACVPGWAVGSGVDGGPALASVPAAAAVAAVTAVTASTAAVVAAVPPGGAVEKGSGVNGTDDASVWGPTPAEASGVHREWAGPGPVPPPARVCGEDDVFANMGTWNNAELAAAPKPPHLSYSVMPAQLIKATMPGVADKAASAQVSAPAAAPPLAPPPGWAPGAGGATTAIPPIVDDAWSVEGDFKSSVQNPDWSFPEEEWAASNPVEPPLQVAPETEAMEGENGKASPDDEEKSEATQQTTGAKPKKKNKKKKKKNKTSDEATGAEEGAGDVDGVEAVEAAGPPEAEEAVNRSEAPVTEAVPLPPVAAVTPPPPLPPVSVVQKTVLALETEVASEEPPRPSESVASVFLEPESLLLSRGESGSLGTEGQAEENWEGVKQAKKAGKKKARREI